MSPTPMPSPNPSPKRQNEPTSVLPLTATLRDHFIKLVQNKQFQGDLSGQLRIVYSSGAVSKDIAVSVSIEPTEDSTHKLLSADKLILQRRGACSLRVSAYHPKNASSLYDLSDLSVSLARVTADVTPLIYPSLRDVRGIVFSDLNPEAGYIFEFRSGESKPVNRNPPPSLRLTTTTNREVGEENPQFSGHQAGVRDTALAGASFGPRK